MSRHEAASVAPADERAALLASPLEVCLVAPLPPPYGGISHWTQMVVRHAKARSDVHVELIDIAPRWREVHDVAVWKRVAGGALQLVRDLARFTKVLVSRRRDVVHLTTSGHLAIARDVAMASIAHVMGVRVVYHIRFGRVPAIAAARAREWCWIRYVMSMADTVVVIDAATEQAIRSHMPEVHVARIPNCIDPAKLPEPEAGSATVRTVMYLGWVIPAKGIGELVEAWARVKPSGWRLHIVGPCDDGYRKTLLAKYRPDCIEFAGALKHEDAMRALATADVFVLPSHTEGFPNVVLEAMALGKAIVATTVGAIPEMLREGSGLLIPPADAEQLAAALAKLTSDEDMRDTLGCNARRHALGEYSLDNVFARYVATWRRRHGRGEAIL